MYPRKQGIHFLARSGPRGITFQTERCLFFPTLFLITARCEEICLYMPHRKTKKTTLYHFTRTLCQNVHKQMTHSTYTVQNSTSALLGLFETAFKKFICLRKHPSITDFNSETFTKVNLCD